LRELDWAPRALRKMRRDVDAAIGRLRSTLGREPESQEIAAALQVPEAEYERMLDQLRGADLATIRQATADGDGPGALEFAVDPSDGPHHTLERQELREYLARAILQLPAREHHILSLYYKEELTLAEIGEVIGVGESRVSQLRTQALARLRSILSDILQRKATH